MRSRAIRPLALGLAGLALAAPPAVAMPLDPPTGNAADEPPNVASAGNPGSNPAPLEQASASGFDWDDAAVGAGGGAVCMLALGSLGAVAVSRRGRLRAAR